MNQDQINEQEWRDRKNWTLLTYRSRVDTRLFVPKRLGFGWTINFGNPRGVILFVTLISLPLVILLTLHWAGLLPPVRR